MRNDSSFSLLLLRRSEPACRWTRGIVLAFVLLCAAIPMQAQGSPWKCPVEPIEPCVKRHGRLSSQNGIALKLWLIGTTRMIAVVNGFENLPRAARKYLEMTSPDHSYIFGDFEVCPVEPDRPGHIRHACLAGGVNLVVKPLRDGRPPFRLLSTWPSGSRRPRDSGGR